MANEDYYDPNYYEDDDLRQDLNGREFRELSLGYSGMPTRDNRERAHRVPNEVLTAAYNDSDDPRVRSDITQFGFSYDNVRSSEYNSYHTKMERRMANGEYNATDLNNKGYQIETALLNMQNEEGIANKSVIAVADGLMNAGAGYCEAVAELDKRQFRGNKAMQNKIEQARRWRDDAYDDDGY